MAIALAGTPASTAGASITASTITVTAPTGSVNDLLIIAVSISATGGTSQHNAPFISTSATGLTLVWSAPDFLVTTRIWVRFVQSGDPTTYTFTTNVGDPLVALVARYSGVSTATPFRFLNATDQGNFAATNTTVVFPPVDNVQSTDLTLCYVTSGTAASNKTQTTALTTPTGWTNVVNGLGPTSSTTASTHVAHALYSKAAGTDTPTVTMTSGSAVAISMVLIDATNEVRPAPSGTITFVNSATTGETAISGTVTVNVPTGVVDGDFMLAAVADPGSGVWTGPAGWEILSLADPDANQGTTTGVNDTSNQLWYRFASSEPASYTFTSNASTHAKAGVIAAWRGLRNPYPIHIYAINRSEGSGATASTTSVVPYTLSNLTVVRSDMLIVNVYCPGGDTKVTMTMTDPASPWIERANVMSAVAADFNAGIGIVEKLGATDLPTATVSAACQWVVYSLALVGFPQIYLPRRFDANHRR